jgi:predicted DNA-binding transcriptional regulator AlpA
MSVDEMTFDKLPEAVAYLIKEIAQIKELVGSKQIPLPVKRVPLGIEDACQIIGKAKPTVYALVRKRLLPCYKNGKKLYFFEDELLECISKGKKKTLLEIESEVEADYKKRSKSIRG